MSAHPRLPLVYATRQALAEAARLLGPDVVLENALTRALADQKFMRRPHRRDAGKVFLDGGVVELKRSRSRLSGRRMWVAYRVRPGRAPRRSPGDA